MNRRVGPGVARPSAEGGSISSLLEPHRHLDAPTRRSGLAKAVSLRARPGGEREIGMEVAGPRGRGAVGPLAGERWRAVCGLWTLGGTLVGREILWTRPSGDSVTRPIDRRN